MRRLLTLLLLLLALPAAAGEPADMDELGRTLGLSGTDEAVLLVVAETSLDQLGVGIRTLDAPAGDEGVYQLVRGLVEGLVVVSVRRGDRVWDGQVRALAGRVTRFDADEALASSDARQVAARVSTDFDLFDFYDALDERDSYEDQLVWCDEVRGGLPAGPDRDLVDRACVKVQSDLAADRAEAAELADAEDRLGVALGAEEEVDERLRGDLITRVDGQARVAPPGSLPRVLVLGLGYAGTGAFTGLAFGEEVRAERQYLAYRDAERVGDDVAMTEHLERARRADRNRDGAIVGGAVSLGSALIATVWQGVQDRRFNQLREERRKVRASLMLRPMWSPTLDVRAGGLVLGVAGELP